MVSDLPLNQGDGLDLLRVDLSEMTGMLESLFENDPRVAGIVNRITAASSQDDCSSPEFAVAARETIALGGAVGVAAAGAIGFRNHTPPGPEVGPVLAALTQAIRDIKETWDLPAVSETEDALWAFDDTRKQWGALGFSRREAHRWHAEGFEPSEVAVEWDNLLIEPAQAAQWRDHDFGSYDAAMWYHAAGFTLIEAVQWRDQFNALEAAAVRAAGYTFTDMTERWGETQALTTRRIGILCRFPDPADAAEWWTTTTALTKHWRTDVRDSVFAEIADCRGRGISSEALRSALETASRETRGDGKDVTYQAFDAWDKALQAATGTTAS